MVQGFDEWQELWGKPVLVAEIGDWCRTEMNSHERARWTDIRREGGIMKKL